MKFPVLIALLGCGLFALPAAAQVTSLECVARGASPAATGRHPQIVQNGNFQVTGNESYPDVGDSFNERTRWTCDLSGRLDLLTLDILEVHSAVLSLSLTTKEEGWFSTDTVSIVGLPAIKDPTIQGRRKNTTTKVNINLLEQYNSSDILETLKKNKGSLDLIYSDDSTVSFAALKIELRPAVSLVPDPYADKVIELSAGSPAPSERGLFPDGALGAPDWDGDTSNPTYTTLGCGGALVVQFIGGGAVNREGPDFRVYEIGDKVEAYKVDISSDLETWYPLGKSGGGTEDFDIAAGAPTDRTYSFLRITDLREDCEGKWPGADIDAVEALNYSADAKPGATSDVPVPNQSDKPEVDLVMEMTPFHTAPDPTTGFSGEPLDAVITVTNKGKSRAFAPQLKIEFSGKAVSAKIRIKAQPAKPRRDDEAVFFDIRCRVQSRTVSCPLGYADQNEEGRPYLEPGESRGIYVEFTPSEPGALTLSAKAVAVNRQNEKVEAAAAQSTSFVGPTLGLVLIGTTPDPYGFAEGSNLPLYEGNEITLRYAIRNSAKGGSARDIEIDFFSRTIDALSVKLASGGAVSCGRLKVSDTRSTECVIAELTPGSTVEIDVAVRYRRWLTLETDVRAGRSRARHVFEIGQDIRPVVTSEFAPQPSATISPGQEIFARFKVRNRGRGKVERAVLQLFATNSGILDLKVDRVAGCKSRSIKSGITHCALESFSAEEEQEIAVIFGPIPEGTEGKRLGLSWALKVRGYETPVASTGNEKGYVEYNIVPRLADLFVAEWAAAGDAEPGVPEVIQFQVGNQGTWSEDNVTVKLRLAVLDDKGARVGSDSFLARAAALLSNPDSPGNVRQVPCRVTGNDAACPLGTLGPRDSASIMFEWNSGDVAAGSYTYEATVSEGLGERGISSLTINNSLRAGADIVATGVSVADINVFNSRSMKDAVSGNPQAFDLWVTNDGTIAQENVAFRLLFDVTPQFAATSVAKKPFLKDVYAVIPSLDNDETEVRKVSCFLEQSAATCLLGRLAPDDAAHIFVDWRTGHVIAGKFRYRAFVSEGAGEAANKTLANNKTSGGAAIVQSGAN